MKHRILFTLAAIALLGGLVSAQREHAEARPGAQSVLYLVADSERDLTTLPSHFTRLSDDDEAKYGGELAAEETGSSEKPSADDVEIENVVNRVGARVASQAHRRLLYRFHYLPDRSFINAFALPGGHVFIGRGLIEHMTTEDELATVLGHEVEHIDHYHCAERLQTELALRKIPLGGVLAIPIEVFQSGYSKEQELEADREGVLLAHRAWYSAAGAVRAFQMLHDLSHEKEQSVRTPQGELVSVATDVLTGYFRSHPAAEDRIAQVREMIARDPSLAGGAERELPVGYIFIAARALDADAKEDFRSAADLAQRALRAHPGYPTALRALFEADLGLELYAAAQDVFRELVARDASVADAAERSAEARATELFGAGQYDREARLIESLLTVLPSQPRLLHAAAWAYAMKGDDAAAIAKAASLRLFYPNDASSTASDAERSAGELLGKSEFAHAASMARVAVALDPARHSAFQTEGQAELAQAHFAAAVTAFERAYDTVVADSTWLRAFSDALGAARSQSASQELQSFLKERPPVNLLASEVRVEAAGLALLAGNEVPAREVATLAENGEVVPELLSRLGLWYLRAARPADAAAVLQAAQKVRPGDSGVQNALAWTQFEEGKPPVETSGFDQPAREALELWQQGRRKDALSHWTKVAETTPQWTNAAWRRALYPPRVNAIAEQLDAEVQRQAELRRQSVKPPRRSPSPAPASPPRPTAGR
jgi:hypothetical protein